MSSYTEEVDYSINKKDESKALLVEVLDLLNRIPNHKYGNTYLLAAKVEKYLKSK